MIDKDLFVRAINTILRQDQMWQQAKPHLAKLGMTLEHADDRFEEQIVLLLEAGLELEGDGVVSWWLYDCAKDRGECKPSIAKIKRKTFKIQTAGDLYDYAVALREHYDKEAKG